MYNIKPVFKNVKFKNDIDKYKLNKEAVYSITHKFQQEQFIKIIKRFTNIRLKNTTITDGTSGVGGDVINFSKHFKYVTGIEINPDTFKLLEKNCENLGKGNIFILNNDYSKIYNRLKQDIIFLDPPWGGNDYKKEKNIKLKIGNYTLKTFIQKIMSEKLCKYIFVKVPFNTYLNGININNFEIIYNIYGMPSYMILCIKY